MGANPGGMEETSPIYFIEVEKFPYEQILSPQYQKMSNFAKSSPQYQKTVDFT